MVNKYQYFPPLPIRTSCSHQKIRSYPVIIQGYKIFTLDTALKYHYTTTFSSQYASPSTAAPCARQKISNDSNARSKSSIIHVEDALESTVLFKTIPSHTISYCHVETHSVFISDNIHHLSSNSILKHSRCNTFSYFLYQYDSPIPIRFNRILSCCDPFWYIIFKSVPIISITSHHVS